MESKKRKQRESVASRIPTAVRPDRDELIRYIKDGLGISNPALQSLETGEPIARPSMSVREPSARELLAEKLAAQLEKIMPARSAKTAARKVTGHTYDMGLIDASILLGLPLWSYEGGQNLAKAAQAAGKGQYGTAALEGALGALALSPAAKPAAAAGKALGKQAAKEIDRAMMTGEGPLGAVLAAARPRFIFVGPKSATWDAQAARRAQDLEKAGKSQAEIWQETKTFRGADGNWRQEISDLGSQFLTAEGLQAKAKAMRAGEEELKKRVAQSKEHPDLFPKQLTEAQKQVRQQIKESKIAREGQHGVEFDTNWRGNFAQYVLEHPELYKAYPHLKDVIVKQGESGPYKGMMTAGSPTNVEISIYKKGLQDDPRSTALHEMQHAIQTYEGWSPGGNAAMAFRDPRAFEILDELRQKALKPMSLEEYKKAYSGVLVSDATLKKEYSKYKKSLPDYVKNLDRDLQQTAAFEYYKRLAGEAEARATQARAPLSLSERAKIEPEQSFDVPFKQQIVKEREFPTAEQPLQAAATAYHGTPHVFPPVRLIEMPDGKRLYQNMDELSQTPQGAKIIAEYPAGRFDLSKIGTGEGAQAYGHGLYFAEAPEVAKSYIAAGGSNYLSSPDRYAADVVGMMGGEEKALHHLAQILPPPGETAWGGESRELIERVIQSIENKTYKNIPGSLYKVDIPDEAVARMLDWDKPLKEQKHLFENVGPHGGEFKFKDLMERIGFDPQGTGGELLQEMGSGRSPEKAAAISNTLREYAIPGIKYLDQGSRGTGEGTRNFVLFSEDLPRILEVNEKPTGAKPWAPGEWGGKPAEVDYARLGMNAPEFRSAPKADLEAKLAEIRAQNEAKGLPRETGTGAIRGDIARRNAMEMLGLPEENTAMDRARAMGMEDFYHASKQDIQGGFKPGYDDNLSFVTDSPEFANQWVGKGKLQSRLGEEKEMEAIESQAKNLRRSSFDFETLDKLNGDEFKRAYDEMSAAAKQKHAREIGLPTHAIHNAVYPMMARSQRTFHPEQNFDELADYFAQKGISDPREIEAYKTGSYLMYENPEMVNYLTKKGFDAMKLRESLGGDYSTMALFNPSQVRSRFAAFDPARMNENDLLGYADPRILPYVGGLGALGALGLSQIEEKPKKKGAKDGK